MDGSWGVSSERFVSGDAFRRALASVGALALALLLGALVILVARSNSDRDIAAERERDSFETIMLARSIEGSMARSEAALGRFVINSDRRLGTIYRDEWRSVNRQIRELQRLTRGNPRQAALARELDIHVDNYGQELSNTANYAAAGRNWEALSLHSAAAASESGPAIIETIERIAENERELLSERSSARIAATERSNALAIVLAVAGILLTIAALGLGWAAFRAFRDRNSADQRAITLETAVAERTAELEALNEEFRAEAAERLAAEQRLRQAQKMEAVGQLTGGIAHDFNNMLAVVIGGLDLVQRKLAKGDANIGRHIDNALEGAHRAAALTRRLLAFARAETLQPEGTDAVVLIRGMAELLQRTLGEQITVSIDAAEGAWPVWVDPHQLENAVLNLAVNARDAMDGKGELEIGIANVSLSQGEVGDAEAGEYLCVSVTDSGCGMDEELIERVFEPFFTTKPVGKGTGLGLSQIFGFARHSRGEVGIVSTPGEGTTVSIYLPRFNGDAANVPRNERRAHRASEPHAPRTILVVEDDDRVRRATVGAVEELGHEAVACADGETALGVLEERDDFDLVLSDVVMPGMTGPELAAKIAPAYPDLPVLFVTGYSGEAGEAEGFAGHEVLRKPFTLAALSDAIARVSEGRPSIAAE